MLVVKANWFIRKWVCAGMGTASHSVDIFKDDIMALRKGDTAEIVGEFDMYKTVHIHKTNTNINLKTDEIKALFKESV